MGQGQGQDQRLHVSVRDGNEGISDIDDGDYCVPSIRRPVEEFVPRSSSLSPLLLPPDDRTMDFSFSTNTLSRNAVNFKGDKDVSFGASPDDPSHDDPFYDTPYDSSYDRRIPSRQHPMPDFSHISRNNDGGGKVGSSGGRWGPGGGRLSVHSTGSSLSKNSDDDSSNFPGSVNLTSRTPGGSMLPSHLSTGRSGVGQTQKQGLSKRHKAMMLSEHPVWEEMTGMSHGDGVHSIALELPDINMNIHASAAAGTL